MGFFRRVSTTAAERNEADAIAEAEIRRLRERSFEELRSELDMTLAGTTVTLSSGVEVFPETQVYWDDEKNRALRIWVRVWRVKTSGFMRPISESDFIKAPSGEFVSE